MQPTQLYADEDQIHKHPSASLRAQYEKLAVGLMRRSHVVQFAKYLALGQAFEIVWRVVDLAVPRGAAADGTAPWKKAGTAPSRSQTTPKQAQHHDYLQLHDYLRQRFRQCVGLKKVKQVEHLEDQANTHHVFLDFEVLKPCCVRKLTKARLEIVAVAGPTWIR